MSSQSGKRTGTPTPDRRRGMRMNSRVQVLVEWEQPAGVKQREEARTRVVNAGGCLLCLSHDLPMETSVRVTNLINKEAASGIVVWKGKQTADGFEHGIELKNPQFDFWGLEL